MVMKKVLQTRTVLCMNLLTVGWGFITAGVHLSQGRYIFQGILLFAFASVLIVIALDGRLLKPGRYPLFRVLYVALLVFLLGVFLLVFRTWYQLPLPVWGLLFAGYWVLYASYIITLIRSQGELSPDE